MINYTSQHQTRLKDFGNIKQLKLTPSNRWIRMGDALPWDLLVQIYSDYFSEVGAIAIDPRIMIGSLIIKHKLNLSDDEAVQSISENPYMQYFLGLDEFSTEPLFSPSLFVDVRKRLGKGVFEAFTDVLIRASVPDKIKVDNGKKRPNKGKLKLDATVADQYIRYPNDLGLLNEARKKTESTIDYLFELLRDKMAVKPRTYRKVAHKKYLAEAKKKQKPKKTLRSAIRYMLNCLDRNIRSINVMLDMLESQSTSGVKNPLEHRKMREFWVIQTLNDQQREMYQNDSDRCDDRIVSISQPHVRPILRGKQGKKTEFGSKIGLSLMDGFVKADTHSWDAYNESRDLIKQAESYKKLSGYYPELNQADKLYATNDNRKWSTKRNI